MSLIGQRLRIWGELLKSRSFKFLEPENGKEEKNSASRMDRDRDSQTKGPG
jgi:hypothetical protein